MRTCSLTRDDAGWLALGLGVLAWELRGVYREGKPLTDYVWAARRWKVGPIPIGHILIAGSLSWLHHHFLIEGHEGSTP